MSTRIGLLVTCSALCFSCSAGDPSRDAGSDAGPPDAGGDAGVDAGNGSVGGIFAISDTTRTADGGTRGQYRVGAHFARLTGVDQTTTSKTIGPCQVETYAGGSTFDETLVAAGTVHVTGGMRAVDLPARPDGGYLTKAANEPLWSGGESLTATADGAEVPSFSTTLTAPSTLTLSASAPVMIRRDAGFSAGWTGSSSGAVILYFSATGGSKAHSATCSFSPGAGTAQVPAAAFADFPATQGFFDFYVQESADAVAAGWSIRFNASSTMVTPAGAAATDLVAFQ